MAFFIYALGVNLAANFYNTPPAIAEYYNGALQVLPAWVLFFDNILPLLVIMIIFILFKCNLFLINVNECMVLFSVSVVACTFTNHSLYITIAFINDPYHATGVTIYYSMFIFIYLVVLKKVLTFYLKERNFKSNGQFKLKCAISVAFMFLVVLGLQILCTYLYIYIPIKDAIDDIPHQLQSLLQLLTTFLVGLITYKFLEQPEI